MGRKLYVIEKQDDLIGKKISHVQINGFNNPAFVVTEDGGLCMWQAEQWDDGEIRTVFLGDHHVVSKVFNHKLYSANLVRLNILTQEELDEFLSDKKAEREQQRKRMEERAARAEREQYERLKAKFEVGEE